MGTGSEVRTTGSSRRRTGTPRRRAGLAVLLLLVAGCSGTGTRSRAPVGGPAADSLQESTAPIGGPAADSPQEITVHAAAFGDCGFLQGRQVWVYDGTNELVATGHYEKAAWGADSRCHAEARVDVPRRPVYEIETENLVGQRRHLLTTSWSELERSGFHAGGASAPVATSAPEPSPHVSSQPTLTTDTSGDEEYEYEDEDEDTSGDEEYEYEDEETPTRVEDRSLVRSYKAVQIEPGFLVVREDGKLFEVDRIDEVDTSAEVVLLDKNGHKLKFDHLDKVRIYEAYE